MKIIYARWFSFCRFAKLVHLYTAKARAVCCQLRHLLRGTLELRARKRTCPGTQVLTGGQTYHRIQSKQVSDTALAAQLQDCYHVASCTPTPQQKGCFFYQVYPVYLICLVKKMRSLRTEMKSGVGRIKNCLAPVHCDANAFGQFFGAGLPPKRLPIVQVDIPSQQSTSSFSPMSSSNLHISSDSAEGLAGSESNGPVTPACGKMLRSSFCSIDCWFWRKRKKVQVPCYLDAVSNCQAIRPWVAFSWLVLLGLIVVHRLHGSMLNIYIYMYTI